MKKIYLLLLLLVVFAGLLFGHVQRASAYSGYYSTYCTGCHGASSVSTCAGCHSHGTHPDSSKSSLNISATTDKTSYQPGETISVTIKGGYRSGWVRALLYDQNMKEMARSTGTVIAGATAPSGAPSFPVTLQAPAPTTPGTYTFNASWYGNKFDLTDAGAGTTFFGPRWTPDPNNPNHGQEIVATNSFTVVSTTPAPAPAISVTDSVSPTTDLLVPFGSTYTGSSSTQTVTVKNTGNADLLVGAVGSTNALAAPFSIKTDACSSQTIAPAASCAITVAFAPTTTGTFSDSFNISSNDPAKSSVTLNVSGNGAAVPVPDITVTDPTAPTTDLKVDFGGILAGTSQELVVTVKNDGNADLVLGSVGSANPLAPPFSVSADACSGMTLVAAASCTISVKFTPVSTSSFVDSFTIPSNDPDESSVVVNVAGQGQAAPVADITVIDSVSPTNDLQVPFGTVAAGSSSSQTVTIRNDGNADLVLGAVGSVGPLAAPFATKTDACSGQTLAPAASCTLTVEFAPVSAGPFADSFNIPSNDPDEASVTVSLSGTGSSTAVGDIKVTDSIAPADDLLIPFGDVSGGRSVDSIVTVANEADGQLVIGSIPSGNSLAGPFSIISDGCSGKTLALGQNCTVTIRFTAPTSCTPSSGTLRCAYSDSFDIPSNDPDEQNVTIQISGASIPASGNVPPSKPMPRYPANGQLDVDTSPLVKWAASSDPDGDNVTYEVRLSTDPSFSTSIVAGGDMTPAGKATEMLYAGTGIGFIFFGFTFLGTGRGRKSLMLIAAVLIMTGTTFVACSSSGGNGSPASEALVTRQVTGLDAGKTYYWKIIANDGNGGVTESDVTSFTTK